MLSFKLLSCFQIAQASAAFSGRLFLAEQPVTSTSDSGVTEGHQDAATSKEEVRTASVTVNVLWPRASAKESSLSAARGLDLATTPTSQDVKPLAKPAFVSPGGELEMLP